MNQDGDCDITSQNVCDNVTRENDGGAPKFPKSLCPLVTMTLLEFPMTLVFICTSQNISPYFFFPFTFPDTYLPGCQKHEIQRGI